MLVCSERNLMKRIVLICLVSATAVTLSSCGTSAVSKGTSSPDANSKASSFLAEKITRHGVELVGFSLPSHKVKIIDQHFYGEAALAKVDAVVVANTNGGAGCPGKSVVVPSGSPFTTLENPNKAVAVAGVSGQFVLAEEATCPVANPLNPTRSYMLFSQTGKLIRSLGSGNLSLVSFGGVNHNLFLGWEKTASNVDLVEGTAGQGSLRVVSTVSPSKGCTFIGGAPSFVPGSDQAVIGASCSSNTIDISLETIEPFSSKATLMSVVRLPKSCVASEVNVSDGGSKGVLVSTVTPPLATFHSLAAWNSKVCRVGQRFFQTKCLERYGLLEGDDQPVTIFTTIL